MKEELQSRNVRKDCNALGRIPLIPRNSCTGVPKYQASNYLAGILKTLQKDNQYTVQNSTEFAEFVLTKRTANDEEIVSFDVVSLFTSIAVKLAIEVVTTKLEQTDVWKETTNLNVEQIVDLIESVVNNSYFTYDGMHYHLLFGCTVGSPVSAGKERTLIENGGQCRR